MPSKACLHCEEGLACAECTCYDYAEDRAFTQEQNEVLFDNEIVQSDDAAKVD